MSVTIYHNPECATSRNVLALLRAAGEDPHVIEYLNTPPDRATLVRLIADSGMAVRDVLRVKDTPYKELGLGNPELTDAELIDAMLGHPILINRPIVVTPRGTRLCRPSDAAIALLSRGPAEETLKEEGAPFIIARSTPCDDPGLAGALRESGLPVDDLREPGRSFFSFGTLDGTQLGYGGFEHYGIDTLIRSIVVEPKRRGTGIGRNLLAVLLREAFDAGARRAWLLTTDSAAFFEKVGFKPVERNTAPEAIVATHQAANLCPSSAVLLSRAITL
ncbi:arsenic resistance N-acetyltransferase ArsN2 [Paraburkholderia phosphatilytica]|uniref:arsenic resistance N-acetyltransferase ArsN2 n=1 Tax=Paraburkholderia phosphatilytica TaxID=2282883 RepID=UPI000E553F05|nr:arsenic resistance N-acetyltransferase ArsN2 [Paraburkholderia phosphatilytica]